MTPWITASYCEIVNNTGLQLELGKVNLIYMI